MYPQSSYFVNQEPMIKITLPDGYFVSIPRQSLLKLESDTLFSEVFDRDPSAEGLEFNTPFITPAVLLTLKYLATGTILEPDSTTISSTTFQAVRNMLTGEENDNIAEVLAI